MLAQRVVRGVCSASKRNMSFARIVSFKVDSVDHGKEIDKIYDEQMLPGASQLSGLVDINRLLCGGELVKSTTI
jgi:hypothetical protein